MKKIRLDPDALDVISFTIDQLPQVRGTVDGAGTGRPCNPPPSEQETCWCIDPVTQDLRCQQETGLVLCPPLDTVDASCMTCVGQPGC